MKPEDAINWIAVIGALVSLGRTTYDEIAGLIVAHSDKTDSEYAAEDDAKLLLLHAMIAQAKAALKAESSEG